MEDQGFQFDVVNPCLGKKGEGREMICLLIHVDDIMLTGRARVVEEFTTKPKKHIEVDVNKAENVGDSFSFLKRKYEVVEEGMLVKPGQYAANMVKTFEEVYGEVKRQKLPCTAEIQEFDTSNLITPQDAAIYRSIVGMGIYLSQERLDIAYTTKELASKMTSPTEAALQHMRKLVRHLKETDYQHILLPMCEKGYGVQTRSDYPWLLESFTDADWSGSKTRRSTSAAVHAINGVIVHSTSRTQKMVSLSSAESELHALVAGACDGICLWYSLEFLTDQKVQHICWIAILQDAKLHAREAVGS